MLVLQSDKAPNQEQLDKQLNILNINFKDVCIFLCGCNFVLDAECLLSPFEIQLHF